VTAFLVGCSQDRLLSIRGWFSGIRGKRQKKPYHGFRRTSHRWAIAFLLAVLNQGLVDPRLVQWNPWQKKQEKPYHGFRRTSHRWAIAFLLAVLRRVC
jgi:hypothetical protein